MEKAEQVYLAFDNHLSTIPQYVLISFLSTNTLDTEINCQTPLKCDLKTPTQFAGLVWLPAFFPHVFGVYITIVLLGKYPRYAWLVAAIGLTLEGVSCLFLPQWLNFWWITFWLCIICFGVAMIDTALLPLLGYFCLFIYIFILFCFNIVFYSFLCFTRVKVNPHAMIQTSFKPSAFFLLKTNLSSRAGVCTYVCM